MNIEEYSKIAPQYFADEAPLLVVKLLKQNVFDRILDCGCGDGSLLYYINKYELGKKAEVNAIDLSKKRVAIAKKISKKFRVRVDSAETLKTVKTASIDFFISEQVIEHVDDKKMVNTMYRVTKKDGIAYLSTVFKKWYGWYFYHNEIGWVLDPTHLREYRNDEQLFRLFKGKFRIVDTSKTLQWFPVVDFFAKRFGRLDRNRNTWMWKVARLIRVPILGYYNWEIVLERT